LFDDPHLNAGGMLPITLRDGTSAAIPALPMQLGDWRPGVRSDLPAPGQHTAAILRTLDNA
jgi:crotonobetainyl-CoA:carnitine CoA-transferase CaiB-like acyl-CoA transferase